MGSRIATRNLINLCRRTGTSHAAGLDARTIWHREAESGSVKNRRLFQRVSQAIDRGASLSEALKQTNHYLPQLFHEMVDVGEQSGRIDQALNQLARYYEHQRSVQRMFLVGIAWPAVQLALAIFVIGLAIWAMGFLQTSDVDVDMFGFGLYGTRGAIIYFATVGLLGLCAFFFLRSLVQGKLSAVVMGPLMQLPTVGRWLQLMAMSRMAWTLGMSVASAMPIKRCAEAALRSTQNKYFTRHSDAIAGSISRGESLYEAFSRTGAFSQDFLDSVRVGEETGKLDESMSLLSQQYEEQGKAAMQALAVAGGVAVWMLVAAIIIFFIFRIAFFYVGLLDNIMNGRF